MRDTEENRQMIERKIKTVLYAADVTQLEDEKLYAASFEAVSEKRRQKTNRYRFKKDRNLSLGAELLLQYGLKAAGANGLNDIVYGDSGKPYLKNSNLFFNLSHSGEYAVCAISQFEVGCDIEKISDRGLKVAKRFFFKDEYENIAAGSTVEEQSDMFFRYWTMKESFMKVTGLGMKLPLDSFRIILSPELSVEQSVDDRSYSFKEFQNIPGYKCSVCTAGDCSDAELHIIDLKKDILRL